MQAIFHAQCRLLVARQQFVILAATEKEAAGAVVLEVGDAGVAERLSVGRLLAGALHPAEEAVGMHAVALQCLPGAVASRAILLRWQQTMIDAPAHAVEEEGGAREFLASEVGVVA